MSLKSLIRRWSQQRMYHDYPVDIVIDNNRACNARCVMCPTQLHRPDQVGMRDELFDRLVQQVAPLAKTLKVLQFGGHGEPFLDKKLEDRAARLAALGLSRIQINTNGSLFLPKRRARLIEAFTGNSCHLTVCVSMESHIPEVFETIRVGLSYADVRGGTEAFISERNISGANISFLLRFVEQKPNEGTFDAYRASWDPVLKKGVDEYDFQTMHNWATAVAGASNYGDSPCRLLRTLTVTHDGVVPLCCVDYDNKYELGSIEKETLLEIYQSPRFKEIQRRHLDGERDQLNLCATCSLPENFRIGKDAEFDELYETVKTDLTW